MMRSDVNGPEITVPATIGECIEELTGLQARADTISQAMGQMQGQLGEMQVRAIGLRHAIAAYEAIGMTVEEPHEAETAAETEV